MENTLEKIEKAWVAIGSLVTILGLTGTFPLLGELFTPNIASSVVAIVGAFITILQFFRGGDPVEIPTEVPVEGSVRSLSAPKEVKYNSPNRHALKFWTKRKVAA